MTNTDQEKQAQRRLEKIREYMTVFMKDQPILNRLLMRAEFTKTEIDLAVNLTIDDYNTTPPLLTAVTILNFPSLMFMVHGCAIQLLIMGGILQSRNELNYSSGGISVKTSDKTQLYQSWLNLLARGYENKKKEFKISVNIEGAYGSGVMSQYATLGWSW